MSNQWLLWACLSAIFAAATAVLSKAGLRDVEADAAQVVRTAVVLAATLMLISSTGAWREIPQYSGRTWAFLLLAGLATAASWVCYFRALAAGPAWRVAAIDKMSVPLVAILAASFLSERLTPLGWVGVITMGLGAALVSSSR
jgi:transporter family protein